MNDAENMGRAARVAHGGNVIVFLDDRFDAVSAKTRDISSSGVFVEVEAKAPLTVGREIDLMVGGRGNSALRATARVVRTAADGFGAQFMAESPSERAVVNRFVSSLSAQR